MFVVYREKSEHYSYKCLWIRNDVVANRLHNMSQLSENQRIHCDSSQSFSADHNYLLVAFADSVGQDYTVKIHFLV